MYNKLTFSLKDTGLALITIHCPNKDDQVNAELAQELKQVCDDINFDTSIRVVIITGAEGKAFSTGVIRKKKGAPYSLAAPLAGLKCPTIAAVNGDATGQGLEMALACDIRIAAHTAHFALRYIEKGLIPSDGATQRLPRLIGRAKAMELMLTGESISADEALHIGLLSGVVPKTELMNCILDMGKKMAGKAPFALRYCKEAVLKGMDMTLDQGLRLEGDLYFLLHTTGDRTEGITAFKQKRKPRFKGK